MALPSTAAGRLPHLDGLRSLALLGVLLYHFNIPMFGGGFLGVDIFFTLSGYLITRNILYAVLHQHNFSLLSFYRRRFFRLFPASCAAILFTLCVTSLFITPDEASSIFKSAIASITLWSNVYFHRGGSYFDETFEMRPLLHFWSLSIEEQFYLIWPPLLLALISISKITTNKNNNNNTNTSTAATTSATASASPDEADANSPSSSAAFRGLSILAVLSFFFASYTHISFPSWTFYELPSRVFQFAIGALLAIRMYDGGQVSDNNKNNDNGELSATGDGKKERMSMSTLPSTPLSSSAIKGKTYDTFSAHPTESSLPSSSSSGTITPDMYKNKEDDQDSVDSFEEPDLDKISDLEDALSILSLLTILLGFVLLPENCPPYLAVLVNIGTALLIAMPDSVVCQVVFTQPLPASLGRASYSIYLIHWPLAIVVSYALEGMGLPKLLHVPLLLPASIFLGYFMFHHIETPLRFPRSWQHVLTVFTLGVATLMFAVYGTRTDGIMSRFPESRQTGWRNDSETIHSAYYTHVQSVTDQFPGSWHPNIHVRQIGDLTGRKSKFVFFGDSFTEHLTGALYYTGMRQHVYFEIHYAFHCGFRATSSLKAWNGLASGFRCADTLPLLWQHIDTISNDSTIVVANWWCSPVLFAPQLIDLRDEMKAHGKQLAIFAEPPGIDETRNSYYPCADLRVLPLGRSLAWLLRRPFVGGRNCLPFDKGNPPEWQTAAQRRIYDRIFKTTLNDTIFFDMFKYLCTEVGPHRYLCRPPANINGVVHNIGYKHDLAHLSNVGSDYISDFVEAELFPLDNRLLHRKREDDRIEGPWYRNGIPSARDL